MQTLDRDKVRSEVVALVGNFPTTCRTPPARKGIMSIPDFPWSGLKLPIWLLAFLLAITYVTDVQMGHVSPFWTFTLQYLSNDINNSLRWGVLTFAIALWSFRSPLGLQLPIWEFIWECECSFHTLPHSQTLLLARTVANPCLGREPKARATTFFTSWKIIM